MRHVFLINPAAGRHNRQAELAGLCRQVALEQGLDYEILVTEYPGHGVQLIGRACDQAGGQRLRIYACGGDGTLNEVLRGAVGRWNVAIAHLPVGTGNDFLKVFGQENLGLFTLGNLVQGREIPLDYIQTNCGNALNVLSVGIDARVAADVSKYKHLPLLGGQGAYLTAAAVNIIKGMGEEYRLTLDGQCHDGLYTMIYVANGNWYGGSFCPVPEARPWDGKLEVLLVRKVSRLTAARVIGAYQRGQYRQLPQYITRQSCTQIELSRADGKPMQINLDGEIATTGHLAAQLQGGLHFVVPRGLALEMPLPSENLRS